MANKMSSSFQAIELPSHPNAGQGGPQTNPGVCRALNTPSTEGIIHTKWYESPQVAPNLIGKNVAERMDQSFRGTLVDNTFNPAPPNPANYSNEVESSFEAANLVNSLGDGSTQGNGPGNFTPPSSNYSDGIGSGVNTSGGGSMNPFAKGKY